LIGCHELTIADSSPCVQLFMKRKVAMPRVIEKLLENESSVGFSRQKG